MAKTAELYDGTTLEFPDDTSNDVIIAAARRETDRLRTEEARKPLPEGVKTVIDWLSRVRARSVRPSTWTLWMRPDSASFMNCE